MRKVYLVQNYALYPCEGYFDTVYVCSTLDDAKVFIETMSLDARKAIDKGEHHFKRDTCHIEFNENVPEYYGTADYQMCIYDEDGYYDRYWIEEWSVI